MRIINVIKSIFNKVVNIKKKNNQNKEVKEHNESPFNEMVGYRIEVRHQSQEESFFIDVAGVVESSVYVRCREKGSVYCKSKDLAIVDISGAAYTLLNVYEYEIRKREVLSPWKTVVDKD